MQRGLTVLPSDEAESERQDVWQSRTCALKPCGLGPNPTPAIYCCVSLGKLPKFSVPPSPVGKWVHDDTCLSEALHFYVVLMFVMCLACCPADN